jgi:hypothetical protein
MQKSLWIMLAVLLVAIAAPHAHADTSSNFTVAGDATNQSGGSLGSCANGQDCAFSGTLTVDVTSGAVTSTDIIFQGLLAFDTLSASGLNSPNWSIIATNSSSENVFLSFSTTPTPGSLLGFTGGSINCCKVAVNGAPKGDLLYLINDGSITPAPTATPEPSSVALMLLGVGMVFVVRKRIGQRLPQAS